MQLIPLLRFNRAIASAMIYPDHPVKAIAISEVVSVIGPFLNPKMYSRIIATTVALMYLPNFAHEILNYYVKNNKIYYQAEICSLLFFLLSYSLYKF